MKRLALLLLFLSSLARADVSFNLDDESLVNVVRVLYGELLQRSYVMDPDFLKASDRVALQLNRVSPKVAEAEVVELLKARGFVVTNRAGVSVITKAPPNEAAEELPLFVYRPRFRSVAYLLDLLTGLFPRGSFSTQRNISQASNASMPAAQGASSMASASSKAGAASPVTESAGSAYSLIDKGETDAFVFRGSDREIAKLEKLLLQLDVASGELLVKAVVYEVRRDNTDSSAVDLVASLLGGKFGISVTGSTAASNALKFTTSNFSAVWSALASDTRFKLVSSPTVRVRSGASARFVAGADVPIIGATTYTQTGMPVQSVEYKSSGVILDLRPYIRDAETDLTVTQQISSFVETKTGVNTSPTLLKRELTTRVSVGPEEVLILGGLDEDKTTETDSGLSWLPSFLRSSTSSASRTEVLVLLNVQRL